ncbi:dihydrodipicolinate synthase family protein [Occultella gossypii]|uniref:Dihydrodipicolinate synthase family protein n=1 Tax=Occultella gossypii TaxID=2800820 RepID=A0ABS7S5A8_9MICO|nr:dihydrodipicolinate synthase family protein [Occultella gossypii]MBZ2195472.1 dihydrodipicolinate synthase family protein [Occultella gossypii]
MERNDVPWRGYWPAAPTPYTADGRLDQDGLAEMISMYVDQGVHGVLINGTTGEWFSQTRTERRTVAEIAVATVAGRIPVVIGCTSYTPAETIDLAEEVKAIGADGALTTPPPYAHPSQAEIYAFYETVTTAVEIPWMAYNWPRGTAVDISVETASRLADLPNVVAIKDSTGDELKCMATVEAVADRVRAFGRFIHPRGMAFMLGVGGDGNIDGGGLGAPFAVPYYDAVFAGDLDAARGFGKQYEQLVSLLVNADYSSKFASPTSQLKAAMNILGQPGGEVRPPLLPMAEENRADLAHALGRAGLPPHQPTHKE